MGRMAVQPGISRHLALTRADPGKHRLGPGAVEKVAPVTADRVVPKVLTRLRLQRRLQHLIAGQVTRPSGQTNSTPQPGLLDQV
jgi:hypothetical protein